MPRKPSNNPKNKIKKQLEVITDTIDIQSINRQLKVDGVITLDITKKTLLNIGKWFLDGCSLFEVQQNLELSYSEWEYLVKKCPQIVLIMQHSTAYADMVVGATLLQTAIGGKIIKKKIPLKVKEYQVDEVNGKSYVVGEHYEMVEVEEEAQPNPMLLKYIAEHKLSEQFGDTKRDLTKEHKGIIENMTEEEIKAIEEYKKN